MSKCTFIKQDEEKKEKVSEEKLNQVASSLELTELAKEVEERYGL